MEAVVMMRLVTGTTDPTPDQEDPMPATATTAAATLATFVHPGPSSGSADTVMGTVRTTDTVTGQPLAGYAVVRTIDPDGRHRVGGSSPDPQVVDFAATYPAALTARASIDRHGSEYFRVVACYGPNREFVL